MEPLKIIRKFWEFYEDNVNKREIVVYGGSGGGKSHSICQRLVYDFFNVPDLHFLIVRKTSPALKATTQRMILNIIAEWGFEEDVDYTFNRSDREITCISNKNLMRFTGVDDPSKLKSSSYNVVYCEEVTELAEKDYFFVKNTIRRPTTTFKNKLYVSFNPIAQQHWFWQKHVIAANKDITAIIHSVYKDNPFLPDEYRASLEDLINQNENLYRVYTLGEPGVLEELIYSNYDIVRTYDEIEPESLSYGLDFGFNHPTALIECKMRDGEPYLRELIYQSHLTNTQLIDLIKQRVPDTKKRFYCDSAEPARIQELRLAGINAMPAEKNVIDGINHLKTLKLHLDYHSPNIQKEIRQYSYIKKGDIMLEEPVKFFDDALDAARYVIFSQRMTGRQPFRSAEIKAALNPEVKPLVFKGRKT